MKNIVPFSLIICSLLFSCNPKQETASVDIEAAQKEVVELLGRFHATMKSKDATGQMNLLAKDGVYCGTDPTEVWDKKTLSDYLTKVFADTTMVVNDYDIDKREIRVDADGLAAYVLEQFTMDVISSKIPLRFTAHAIKKDGQWQFDFTSISMIPLNEDLGKLNIAVQ